VTRGAGRLGSPGTLGHSILHTVGTSVLAVALSLVGTLVVARALGPGEKGAYDLLLATSALMATVLGLSLPPGITYVVARGRAAVGALAAKLAPVVLLQCVVAGLFLHVTRHTRFGAALLPGRLGGSAVVMVMVLLAGVSVGSYCKAILVGQEQIVRANRIELAARTALPVMLLAAIAAAGVAGARMSAEWLAWVTVGAGAAAALLWARPIVGALRARSGPAGVREVAAFALPLHLGNLAQFLNYRVDIFVVSFFVGAAGVGLYTLAGTIAQLVWVIANAAAGVMLPRVASVQDAREENIRRTVRATRLTFWASVGAAALLAAFVGPALPLFFGASFRGSVAPLLLLLPGVAVMGGAFTIAAYFTGMGRPQINLWIAVAGLAVTVAADLVLIPRLGIRGAALASTLSYVTTAVLTVAAFVRMTGASVRDLVVPMPEDLAMLRRVAQPNRPG
jgi:O-antigen/teichoic acid export membrane protein